MEIGWVMLPLAVIGMLPAIEKNDTIVGEVGTVVIIAECVVLVVSIFFVERALGKKFDKDGNVIF